MSDERPTVAVYRWEVNLSYPMDSSYTGESTEMVDAEDKEMAIAKAKRQAGMYSAKAYPVYQLSEVDDAAE